MSKQSHISIALGSLRDAGALGAGVLNDMAHRADTAVPELVFLCCWELQSQAFSSVALRQSPARPGVP